LIIAGSLRRAYRSITSFFFVIDIYPSFHNLSHSLGGALGTVCAYDMSRWAVPTVKRDLKAIGRIGDTDKILLSVYTYGSPRVGDIKFANGYDAVCKDTQRIICDGDIITTGPPAFMNYMHVGRENIFDFTGSVRVNPSIVEKTALKSRTDPNRHRLKNYAKVIKLARQPYISLFELLNLLRDAYGIDRIVEKKNEGRKEETVAITGKPVPSVPKGEASSALQQVQAQSPSSQIPPPSSSPRDHPVSPVSNAFDILYG